MLVKKVSSMSFRLFLCCQILLTSLIFSVECFSATKSISPSPTKKPLTQVTIRPVTTATTTGTVATLTTVGTAATVTGASTCTTSDVMVASVPAISNVPILPDTDINRLNQSGCDVLVSAAVGEYEPASIVIKALQETINDATINVTNLVGTSGTIASSNIDIKAVKVWYQSYGAWFEIGRPAALQDRAILVPELLVNDEKLVNVDYVNKKDYVRHGTSSGDQYVWEGSTAKIEDSVINLSPNYTIQDAANLQVVALEKAKNKQIWFTIQVPKNTSPGTYIGNILISRGVKNLATIKLQLNVLPFALQESRLEYGMYYHGRIHITKKESISSEYKSPQQLKVELLDMVQHGIKNPIIYQPHFGDENVDAKGFTDYLTIRKELGIDNSKLYLMYLNTEEVGSAAELDWFKKSIQNVKALVQPFGTKEIYIYGKDEATGQALTNQRQAWTIAHQLGCKVYVAGSKGTFELVGDLLDLFVSAYAPMLDEARKFHSVGHKIFSYANSQSGVENPYLYRRNYGVLIWAAEFDGAMVYAYQHSMGDGWNDFDNEFRDHNFAYPTSNGVVKTLAWEGLREGIDDIRYITTLEQLMKASASNPQKKPIIDQATQFLNKLKNDLNKLNKPDSYTESNYFDLDKLRSDVIGYIKALS